MEMSAFAYNGSTMLALQRERLLEAYRNGEASHWQESFATLGTRVRRGKRAQLRYAKGRGATLYPLPGDEAFAAGGNPGQRRRPRSQRGRRGALRRARLNQFLEQHREETSRALEAGEEPVPMYLSTRLTEEEYLPGQRSSGPFVPGDPAPPKGHRWKQSLRLRRRAASWLAAPRYLTALASRRWLPRVHLPDRGFRSTLALRPYAEAESRRDRAYLPHTFGHSRSYLARRLR